MFCYRKNTHTDAHDVLCFEHSKCSTRRHFNYDRFLYETENLFVDIKAIVDCFQAFRSHFVTIFKLNVKKFASKFRQSITLRCTGTHHIIVSIINKRMMVVNLHQLTPSKRRSTLATRKHQNTSEFAYEKCCVSGERESIAYRLKTIDIFNAQCFYL